MKKIIILSMVFIILQASCGFKPTFSSKDVNFAISKIEVKDKSNISRKIKNNLKIYKNVKNPKNIYSLKINSTRQIDIVSKDKKGNPSNFEMNITTEITIFEKLQLLKSKNFTESFNYENSSNKFDLKQYEKNIENNLTNKIIENITLYLYTK